MSHDQLNPDVMPLTRARLERRTPQRDRADQRPGARWTLVLVNGRMPTVNGRLILVDRHTLAEPGAHPGQPEVYLGELTGDREPAATDRSLAGHEHTGQGQGVTVRPFMGVDGVLGPEAHGAVGTTDPEILDPTSLEAQARAAVRVVEDAARTAVHTPPDTQGVQSGTGRVEWISLRAAATALGDSDPEHAALAVTAQAVVAWHVDHPRCPRCGEVTEVQRSGWMRRCPADDSMHFPRTDPAVIVAISDGNPDPDAERILLGRSAAWRGDRFSTLAGFVEPGESIEQAVVREIEEEAGVVVGQVRYRGSQPWPFPRSLMIGCTAVVQYGDPTPDGEEVVQLRWFTRAELREVAATGDVVLPGRASIARALIELWAGESLTESDW